MSIWKIKILFAVIFCLFFIGINKKSYGAKALHDSNLSLPVLIIGENNTGSGFFMESQKGVFFITARHVLYEGNNPRNKNITLISYYPEPKDKQFIVTLDIEKIITAKNIKSDVNHDVAVMRVLQKDGKISQFVDGVSFQQPFERIGWCAADYGGGNRKYDEVLISNDVYIFGYPTSLGLQEMPQFDPTRPLVRKGIIAGKNDNKKSIIIDAPVYPGNSGGPVMMVDEDVFQKKFLVIGIISEFIPLVEKWKNSVYRYDNVNYANSGYAVVIPMDYPLGLIQSFHEGK